MIIFDFNKNSNISNWRIINDTVMGGKSKSTFYLNEEGKGVFEGTISVENNGGFSFLNYRFDKKNIEDFKKVIIILKGDGKSYQFRIKSKTNNQHSYTFHFQTTEEYQKIKISLSELLPTYRGIILDMPNFKNRQLEEIGFLIANKSNEQFKVVIDKISLE